MLHHFKQRRLAAAFLLALTVAGCGASAAENPPTGRVRPAPAASALAPSQTVLRLQLPVDEYQLSVDEIYYTEGARDRLTRACMRARGFDWQHVARPKFGDWRNRRRYGVIELAVAKRYGYHPVRGLLAPVEVYNEKVRRENNLSDKAWVAAERGASGCEKQAQSELTRGISYDTSRAGGLGASTLARAKRTAAVRQATRAWARCMRGRGFNYQSPDAAVRDRAWGTPAPSPRERAVATADVRCKDRAHFVQTLANMEAKLQRAAIARDAAYFRRLLDHKNSYLRRARGILAAASVEPPGT